MKRRVKLWSFMMLIVFIAVGLGVRREMESWVPSYQVQGEVKTPGRVPLKGNVTVLDALNQSGGLLTGLSETDITLVRPAPTGQPPAQTLPVDFGAILLKGDPRTNYRLMPGDRLIVKRSGTGATATSSPASLLKDSKSTR